MTTRPLDPGQFTPLFGQTRTRLARDHALMTPDGFVLSFWPGAKGVVVVHHITPALGAGFVQFSAHWSSGGKLPIPKVEGVQRFIYVTEGAVSAAGAGTLHAGGFLYLPPGTDCELTGGPAAATVFEKRWEPEGRPPPFCSGHESDIPGAPFLGNARTILKPLLTETQELDMAVNLLTFEPGATLPFVETHVMEHGLVMLRGQGVYRLGENWYPVQAGDVIWMAPYCPQWFVASGDTPATYLYYKNINRLPHLP